METSFYNFLILKILEKNITCDDWLKLFKSKDYFNTWKFLKENKLEKHFNFILTTHVCEKYFDFSLEFSDIEKKFYDGKCKHEIRYYMIKTLEIILKNNFNEIIKNDLDIVDNKNVWVGINLDSLYFLNINHFNYNNLTKNKKNRLLYEKILKINLIVRTLERLRGVFFYTKLKQNEYPQDLVQNINFTKGYLICFEPDLVTILRNYKYTRKLINTEPKTIDCAKNITFLDSLKNSNFSTPIWLNENNLSITDYTNIKIFNKKLLKKNSKIKVCVSTLNFLNSIKLTHNAGLLDSIITIIEKNTNIHHTLSTKSSLKNMILLLNNEHTETFTEITSTLSTLIQSASILELIKEQLSYYPFFYLDHRLDLRLRIYCYPWPINYQLNHLIRVTLQLSNSPNIPDIWKNFWIHPLIKKYVDVNYNIFEFNLNPFIEEKIKLFFEDNFIISPSQTEDKLKKEYFYQLLIKLSPNSIKNTEDKILFSLNILDDFTSANMVEDWELWLKKLGKKNKKLPYILNYQNSLQGVKNNNFKNMFWSDASSNAIQLIVFRLKIDNSFLLKLVNIYDNDTGYTNIYEYITEKIKEKDHSIIIQNLKNKLTSDEINSLQDIDNNKYLLMPSTYGMGKFAYREKLDLMVSADHRKMVWTKLDKSEKSKISDYFWNLAEAILLDIGFNLSLYKNHCKSFYKSNNYDAFIWKNDLGITISPISLEKSKRHLLLKKLNTLKLKKKEILDSENNIKLDSQIKETKTQLQLDDKKFWKRTMVKTEKHKIYSRIYFREKYGIDRRETQQSLIPNTIHAYDSSVMHLSLQICKKLKIEVLTIHDSIGSHPLTLPLVKLIFKVANILLLDNNNKKNIFPLNNITPLDDFQLKRLFKEILKSKNFFS